MTHPKHSGGPSCAGCDSRVLEAHQELQDFFYHFKKIYHDMHCAWGYRGEADQAEAFKSGASNAKFGESAHNVLPSRALDLFQIIDGVASWDPSFCIKLYKEALEAGFVIKNGGDFKVRRNGKLVKLGDYGHFELA